MDGYEFTEEQNAVISSLNLRVTLIGLINIITAVIAWIIYASNSELSYMINGVITLVIALAFIIPMQDLMKVVRSEGSDIEELMRGFKRLNKGWLVFIVGFAYLTIFDYISAV